MPSAFDASPGGTFGPLDYSNLDRATGTGARQPPKVLGPGARDNAGNYSSSMVIEEVAGAGGAQPRQVTLQGPSLPLMGAEWGGENALVTKWYPGNGDEATQQDLGPRDLPSTWHGEWNRTRFGRAPATSKDSSGNQVTVVDPNVLADALEEMFRAGLRLRVTWVVTGAVRGKKVREGRAKTWKWKYTRLQDIEWEVTFEWVGRGARVQKAASTRDGGLTDSSAALNVELANLASLVSAQSFVASNSAIYKSATPLTLGQLENLANAPTQLATALQRNVLQLQHQLQDVVGIAQAVDNQPVAVANAAVNTARNAVAVANQFADQLGRTPVEALTLRTDMRDLLRSARYFGQVSDAAIRSSLASQNLANKLQLKTPTPAGAALLNPQSGQTQQGDFIAAYVARDGDTPQRVSQRFYGTPDHAVDILQANRLPWFQPTLPKGKVLFIPTLKSSQRAP